MNALVKLVTWTVFFYLAYCALLFLMQRQMMFPRNLIDVPSAAPKISGLQRIWLDTGSGKVETWFLPPAANDVSGPSPTVIFAHGNGEVIDFWPEELMAFNRLGVGVLLVEYPGYGRSQGSPSQQSIAEVFVDAYDMLAARQNVDPARIVLFGRSLGGGAVCSLAAQRPSAALILMSTFTSAGSFAARYLAPQFLVRDPFDNLNVVKNYAGPILIIHGQFDEVIPYRHATTLHQAAKRGQLITYACGHNDCPPHWNVFWQDMATFLHKAGIIEHSDSELP